MAKAGFVMMWLNCNFCNWSQITKAVKRASVSEHIAKKDAFTETKNTWFMGSYVSPLFGHRYRVGGQAPSLGYKGPVWFPLEYIGPMLDPSHQTDTNQLTLKCMTRTAWMHC